MKAERIGLLSVVLSAACSGGSSDEIEPGEVARAMGVSAYRTERIGDRGIIHMMAPNGFWIGRVEVRLLTAGEIAFEDVELTDADVERFPYIRVRHVNPFVDQELATFLGPERPGYECPRTFRTPTIHVTNVQTAALTDPALAPFLEQFELTVEPRGVDNYVMVQEVAFDGSPTCSTPQCHQGSCQGHRVPYGGTDPMNYPFVYSYCTADGGYQTIYNYSSGSPWTLASVRHCYGGSIGNGVDPPSAPGGTCCNGGDCNHPSPMGPSSQPDCGGYTANGCVFVSGIPECTPTECCGPCAPLPYDNCGHYNPEFCFML